MKKDFYLARYALIIKKLETTPADYSQLEDYLLTSFEFQDAGVQSYSIRTLQRDIREISRLFNLTIHNKKKGDKRYYIDGRPDMEVDEYNQKLLETFQVNNAINQRPDFAGTVFFESRKPSGVDHFYDLFFAIRNKRIVEFEHYNYKNKIMTSSAGASVPLVTAFAMGTSETPAPAFCFHALDWFLMKISHRCYLRCSL
ncbi:hypothetical protein SAMN05421796_108151 [Chryseobacterium piscicola]|uniref:WYL domain-containing protein n=1 Tax=Chryseobacterium piscicola TaxID=551459 RepID=A0A1N7NM32_9FLAO|nr:hypothetical protein [Chryseobacterium piscicola]SIS99455.1 hypothetical protein SAMN05421796_108151 [Chryseobacterium piscicola]